jgi:hypothetical protein
MPIPVRKAPWENLTVVAILTFYYVYDARAKLLFYINNLGIFKITIAVLSVCIIRVRNLCTI